MLGVTIEYADGRVERVQDDFIDLLEASGFALALADRLGAEQGDGHGPPRWVRIMRNSAIELSISIIRGGLLSGSVG